ncbi:MAG: ABC transporter ATP-binding protein [Micrococcaceae bacterium]
MSEEHFSKEKLSIDRLQQTIDRLHEPKELGEETIIIDDIFKRFTLRNTRSIKEALVWLVRGRKEDLKETFLAIDGVSYSVREGESVALLGFNGSGKSTSLKMISGVMQPDSGNIYTKGRIAGLIEVGAGFHHDLTGRENVYLNGSILGMSIEEIDEKFDDIVAFSEIEQFIDTEVKFYSSGMFLRLAFSVAIHTDPDIFLVDEILAVGDEPFQEKCKNRILELKEEGKTLVVVSHDLGMIEKICERGIVMQKGKKIFDGPILNAVRTLREEPQLSHEDQIDLLNKRLAQEKKDLEAKQDELADEKLSQDVDY